MLNADSISTGFAMKKMMLFSICIALALYTSASHKLKRRLLHCTDATYSDIHDIRKVGRVYEFMVQARKDGILIDSVWFGATPVPCDVYDIRTRQRIRHSLRKGQYMVRANRDLYANYPAEYDSVAAFRRFVAPFAFRGTACLMYSAKGKRGYTVVQEAKKVEGKQLR